MIPALVYSRNRAAQLDLLLRSAARYAPWIAPTVLYRRRDSHEHSYFALRSEHLAVDFIIEYAFERQTREFLAEHERFMWLVDDAVFFRPAPEPTAFPWTTRIDGGHRWRDHPPTTEQGYPLAVCDTAYESDTILPLLDFAFADPNELERGLHARRERFEPETIHGAGQSLCTIEHNAVSASSCNPTMGGDVDELRDLYMAGKRLDLDALKLGPSLSPHVQVPLVWQ